MDNTNAPLIGPLLTIFMPELKEKLDDNFAHFITDNYYNTNTNVDATIDNIIHHAFNIQEFIGNMATEIHFYQQKSHADSQNHAMSLPSLYQRMLASKSTRP